MAQQVETDDLTTLAKAKRHLGIPEGEVAKDTLILSHISAASGWARAYTEQPLKQRAVSWSVAGEGLLMGDGTPSLLLPAWPVLAISALNVDVRGAGLDWAWDDTAHVETGGLRYGATVGKQFLLDQQNGILRLTDGWVFPAGPYVSVDAVVGLADGTTAMPLPMHGSFPFSATIFSAANDGGKRHTVFGWEGPRGDAITEKINELVAWYYRQGERASQGMASQSGGGSTITYSDNVPTEIRQFFDRWKRSV